MTALEGGENAKSQEVWDQLATVADPELDEAVTEMGFVETVHVDEDDGVHVRFRLPTYWCAANFAFLMANDMREALEELPWVQRVQVELSDHYSAEQINRGVAQSGSLRDTFPNEADSDLDELRSIFGRKAFQRRQEVLLRYLLQHGQTPQALLGLRVRDLRALPMADAQAAHLLQRYLDGLTTISVAAEASSPAFVTVDGQPLDPKTLKDYLRTLRHVRINMDFNANMCRSLLQARYANTSRGERLGLSQPE